LMSMVFETVICFADVSTWNIDLKGPA
jgi:hypothetical protein